MSYSLNELRRQREMERVAKENKVRLCTHNTYRLAGL